jgi:hypothetical protein
VRLLAEFADKERHDIVVIDCKGESPDEISSFLRDPQNLRVWRDALINAINRANNDFATRKTVVIATVEERMEYERWRKRHGTYKAALERRLRECKELIHNEAQDGLVRRLKEERNTLVDAIKRHRDAFGDEFEDEPSDEDVRLWRTLEQFE